MIADPEIEAVFPELQRVRVVIKTTDGREVEKQLDYPKGDPRNPLSDDEIAAGMPRSPYRFPNLPLSA